MKKDIRNVAIVGVGIHSLSETIMAKTLEKYHNVHIVQSTTADGIKEELENLPSDTVVLIRSSGHANELIEKEKYKYSKLIDDRLDIEPILTQSSSAKFSKNNSSKIAKRQEYRNRAKQHYKK